MIKKLVLKTFFALFVLSFQMNAQISTREIPVGYNYNFGSELMPIIVMPPINLEELQIEDKPSNSFFFTIISTKTTINS